MQSVVSFFMFIEVPDFFFIFPQNPLERNMKFLGSVRLTKQTPSVRKERCCGHLTEADSEGGK